MVERVRQANQPQQLQQFLPLLAHAHVHAAGARARASRGDPDLRR